MSMFVVPRALGIYKAGTLAGSTDTIEMEKSPIPCTITFKSFNGSRKIEISTDGGVEFFPVVYDNSSATSLAVAIRAPISHVKFTGAAADTWSVR